MHLSTQLDVLLKSTSEQEGIPQAATAQLLCQALLPSILLHLSKYLQIIKFY